MKFYTHTFKKGNFIYVRGYDSGKRFTDKVEYSPTLYVNASDGSGDFKTIYGEGVKPVDLGDMRSAREFCEKYESVHNFPIYGSTDYEYVYLNEQYGSDYDPTKIKVINIDIEVESENGFPEPLKAVEKVISIALSITNRKTGEKNYFVFGLDEYKRNRLDVTYKQCANEKQLLSSFIDIWQKIDPDIITGWNTEFFDIPYLVNRISRVLGDFQVKKLSPYGIIKERTRKIMNRDETSYDIFGVESLDYLQLYKKFTYNQQESYKLDHIAYVELGERKVDYSEYDNLHQLYKHDYKKFIDYNIKDVELIDRLEEKMKFIEMALALAYDAKVNYRDVFTQVRMWDVMIHNFLMGKNIVVPPKTSSSKSTQFEGAYVKAPQVGMHNYVLSFDLNSLYPMLIQQYNISPDTFDEEYREDFSLNDVIGREYRNKTDLCIAANGTAYRKDKRGFLGEMMKFMYESRSEAKKMMLKYQNDLEAVTADLKEDPENKSLLEKKQSCVLSISKYKNLQLAKKVQLNSCYGAMGNQYFRFFDVRIAEAITMSGQLSIRWIEARMNEYMNNLLKTDGVDYVIASDTDSLYISFEDLVGKVFDGKDASVENIVDFLDKIARNKIEPIIDGCYQELADTMNAYEQKMTMKREVIADKGIWTAKKRYILNVYDNEGVRYTEPKLKMMGIETVKSSTPELCRNSLKEALSIIMNKDEASVQKFVSDFKAEFSSRPFEDVSAPRGISDLSKYDSNSADLDIPKGCPIHVRGSLIYNHLIKKHKLTRKYEKIRDGDKVKFCYMKVPNPTKNNVLSSLGGIPKEFSLEEYIDYDLQFEKVFLEPLKAILSSIGWSYEKNSTLEGFFGD